MEILVLSYVNVLYIYPKLCLQVCLHVYVFSLLPKGSELT